VLLVLSVSRMPTMQDSSCRGELCIELPELDEVGPLAELSKLGRMLIFWAKHMLVGNRSPTSIAGAEECEEDIKGHVSVCC